MYNNAHLSVSLKGTSSIQVNSGKVKTVPAEP